MTTWLIVTGEYPPDRGGVSDYTQTLAHALAAAGDRVEVVTRGATNAEEDDNAVRVVRLANGFDRAGLLAAGRMAAASSAGRRILLQYVPHAFGYKSMNVALCRWAARATVPLDVMFHEVACGFAAWPLRNNVLAVVHRIMARILCAGADRIFVSTGAWESLLRSNGAGDKNVEVLAIPSSLPTQVNAGNLRSKRRGRRQIGHFGIHRGPSVIGLEEWVVELLGMEPELSIVLIGSDSDGLAESIRRWHPSVKERVFGTGLVTPQSAAEWIASCDLMVQAYPGGASLRRTSLMAPLALGVAVVTNEGVGTERCWRESGAVELGTSEDLVWRTRALLADEARRAEVAMRGRSFYQRRVSLQRAVGILRKVPADSLPSVGVEAP